MSPESSNLPRLHQEQPYPGQTTHGHPTTPTPPTPPAAAASQIEPKPTRATPLGSATARIALAHDWLVGLRGGEFVLDSIARTIQTSPGLGTANLYTLFSDHAPLTEAIDAIPTRDSSLSPLVAARRWLLPAYPAAASQLTRILAQDHHQHPIDLLVSTSSVAAKAIRTPRGVPHLCYCHTPARYLWDQQHEYTRGHTLRGSGLRVLSPWLRSWDRKSAQSVTTFLANSRFTADRIERYWGRAARVVHPPIDTDYYTPDPTQPRKSFWLVVSALEPYKRVDLVIEAAKHARQSLIIVGEGSQWRARRDQAVGSPWIEFKQRVSRETLRTLYRTARCLVFPQIEDFGMAAAEAQACGCPVVARDRGGAAEIVIDGETGSFFSKPSPDEIRHAAHRLPQSCDTACRANAARFAPERFEQSIYESILSLLPPATGPHDEAWPQPAASEANTV